MKSKEEVCELFLDKYNYLKTIYSSVGEFNESYIYPTPNESGWQLNLDQFAAITLRSSDDKPHEIHGGICRCWYENGGAFDERGNPGELGFPTSDEEVYAEDGDPADRISHFENGDIIWTAKTDTTRIVRKCEAVLESDPALQVAEKSPELVSLLNELDKELEKLDKIGEDLDREAINQDSKSVFEQCMSAIARQRRAFDSKTFFMVTFGMLKAGKSTLVNTFVGKEVSPVGREKETTLRSSIILAADEEHKEGIYVYSPRGRAESEDPSKIDEWEMKNVKCLMEYLGKIIDRGELNKSLDEEIVPFTGEELDNLLTKEVDPRFPNMLPPVIRVDIRNMDGAIGTANLLKGGVAIIDTPGLDGIKSNMHKDLFLRKLKDFGDYYLLVQSSMSAMNGDCRKQLEEIFQYVSNAPLLVVYNEIAASFWLKPELEKEKLRSDAEDAAKELVEKLRQLMKGLVPECISINAGESADAMFGAEGDMQVNKNEMLNESRILKLRSRILKTLRDDRLAIKESTARERMMQELRKAIDQCKEQCKRVNDKAAEAEKKWQEERKEIEATAGELCNAFNDKDGAGSKLAKAYGDGLKTAMNGKVAELQNPWRRGIEKDGKMQDCKHAIPNAVVDKELKRLCDNVRAAFIENIEDNFDKGVLRRSNTPWKDIESDVGVECQNLKELWDKLQRFLDKDYGSRDVIPDCLLNGFNVNELVKFAHDQDFNPSMPNVDNPWWRFAPKTKYEYCCYDAWQQLFDQLKRRYFGEPGRTAEAMKKAQEAFCETIQKKGYCCALALQSNVSEKINRLEEDSARRIESVKKEQQLFADAISCMEKMQEKLNVIKSV